MSSKKTSKILKWWSYIPNYKCDPIIIIIIIHAVLRGLGWIHGLDSGQHSANMLHKTIFQINWNLFEFIFQREDWYPVTDKIEAYDLPHAQRQN